MSAQAGGLHVSGGSHGTTATLDALDALAAGLGHEAVAMAGGAAAVAAVATSSDLLLSVALDPGGGGRAVALLADGARGLAGLSGGLAATAGAVAAAVTAYRSWDARTAASAEVLRATVGGALLRGALPAALPVAAAAGAWGTGSWAVGRGAQAWASARGATPEEASAVGDVVQALVWAQGADPAGAVASSAWDAVGPSRDEVADLGVHGVLGVAPAPPLAGLLAHGLYGQPTTATARLHGEPRLGAAPVAGVGGLITGAGRLRERTAGIPGAVEVARTPGAPGEPARVVVSLPATQEGVRPGGPNPADMETNLLAVAREATAVTDGTVAALRAAGVQPGDQVAFVGFSQGGLSALALAADPRVREICTPRAVVTAGSPTATQRPPGGVSVLSVEHDGDPVPALDGASNPDLPGWTTVRAATDGEPHDAGSYARTGALVDASADPSLVDATAELAPFLAMDGTTTVSRFELTRTGDLGDEQSPVEPADARTGAAP